MYVEKKKKLFAHFECWEQVKDHQTFITRETNTPRTNTYEAMPVVNEVESTEMHEIPNTQEAEFSTPESHHTRSSSPIRPPGVKAAKEARRKGNKVAAPINEVHSQAMLSIAESQKQTVEQNKLQMERDWQMQQMLLEQNQQKLDQEWKLQKYQMQLKEREDETRIMLMDTNIMTPKSKKFFSKRKAEILQRHDEVDNNDDGGSDDFSNCYRPLNFDD